MKLCFTGVYTQEWQHNQFLETAREMKSLGLDSWAVKVADGTEEWYSGIQAAIELLRSIEAEGIRVYPYGYGYGNKFGGLNQEAAIANAFTAAGFSYIYDAESQWANHTDWTAQFVMELKKPIILTTFADPALQNWTEVLRGLNPACELIMPQVYTYWLAHDMRPHWTLQFETAGVPLSKLTAIASNETVLSFGGVSSLALWDWQGLSHNQIRAALATLATEPSHPMEAAYNLWASCHDAMGVIPSFTTGIARDWVVQYLNKVNFGPPISLEYHSINWDGKPVICQNFEGAWCEWFDHAAHWHNWTEQYSVIPKA